MSHARITAATATATLVDQAVAIRHDERIEVALAEAWHDALGGRCAARESRERSREPDLGPSR